MLNTFDLVVMMSPLAERLPDEILISPHLSERYETFLNYRPSTSCSLKIGQEEAQTGKYLIYLMEVNETWTFNAETRKTRKLIRNACYALGNRDGTKYRFQETDKQIKVTRIK